MSSIILFCEVAHSHATFCAIRHPWPNSQRITNLLVNASQTPFNHLSILGNSGRWILPLLQISNKGSIRPGQGGGSS